MKDEVLRTRHSLSIFVPMLPSTVTCIAFSSSCYAAKKCVPSNRRQKKSSVYMQEKKKDVSSRFWLAVSVVTSNTRDVFTKFQNTEIYITQRRELKINTTPRRILSTNFGVFSCLKMWSKTVLCQSVFGIYSKSKLILIGKRRKKIVKNLSHPRWHGVEKPRLAAFMEENSSGAVWSGYTNVEFRGRIWAR